ncbi:MAG TPA: YlbF family regulator [Anaerolineales bacterium]|nr:YlbF family regulator [Anaerolineales bacterium]
MEDKVFDDIEIAPPSVVLSVARDFAAALAETPQYKAFEQAAERFRQDQAAQQAMEAYREKQMDWRPLLMLNALSAEQTAELEGLQNAFVNHPVVQEYFKAQTELVTLCQTLGDALSQSIGLNYAAACGVSCCG